MKRLLNSYIILFSVMVPLLCGQGAKAPAATKTTRPLGNGVVLVGPNDTVTITALNADELSKAWRVGSSGDLNLPMVGRIHAAGMTVEELEREIETRLKKYIKEPQVTVYASEVLSHPVTVSGAVANPGVIELTGPTSLFSVMTEAGGPKPTAAYAKISRPIEEGSIPSPFAEPSFDRKYTTLQIPLNSFQSSDGENANFVVLPGDVITVPEMRPRMVYITGEVIKPGAIELATQDTVNLTKALAIAGGLNHTAKPSKTMIRHVNENGVETALAIVDVQKILSGKAKDVLLSDGDILIIPNNQLLSYLQLGAQSAIASSAFMIGRL